jgi:ABC-type Fe3+/spermidine/putrescine transport system ATPase subunit
MTALLEAQDLGRFFGNQPVFQSVTLAIQTGQHLALLGSSGGGKSTLLRLLAGLDAPEQGRIWIDGKLVSEPRRVLVPPHQRGLAMVFQDLALWPALTALENVLLGLGQDGSARRERIERAKDALEKCRVGSLASRKPAALSIGQQQRVALARALAVRPKLLLLDEAFASLDLPLKQELMGELEQLVGQFGLTLLLVTHDPFEACVLCTHALVLEGGGVVEQGRLSDLLAAPVSRTLQAFARQPRLW